jgi:hypothetical protein
MSYQPRRRGAAAALPSEAKTARFWLQRTGLIILLIAGVASVINVLSLSPQAKVLPLNSNKSLTLHSQAEYQAAAQAFLSDSIWDHNKITVDTADLRSKMLHKFPELTDVSVTIPLLAHRPVVYVEPAQPALVLVTSQGAFVLDNSGKALIKADNPVDLKQPSLPVISDQSNIDVQLNHQALPADTVAFLKTVIGQLSAKQLKVTSVVLPVATSEADVKLEGKPYAIKFNLQDDSARQQVGTYLATIQYLEGQHITPAQYVDVRAAGRAYYQ